MLKVKDLSKDHPVVKASKAMVAAYAIYPTMVPALEKVAEQHPDIDPEHLICLWLGINAVQQSMA